MRLIPLDEATRAAVSKWVEESGARAPGEGLLFCAGPEAGSPRGFATVKFHPGLVAVDGLIGTKAGCRYIVALCEEMAVAQGSVMVIRGIGARAVEALDAEGAVAFSEGHWWGRDPAMPKPEEAKTSGPAPSSLDELEDEDEDVEDDEEDGEEPEPAPSKKQQTIQPRRKRKNKRKR